MISNFETLITQSLNSSQQGRTVLNKQRKLDSWGKEYQSDGCKRIDTLITIIKSELKKEVATYSK